MLLHINTRPQQKEIRPPRLLELCFKNDVENQIKFWFVREEASSSLAWCSRRLYLTPGQDVFLMNGVSVCVCVCAQVFIFSSHQFHRLVNEAKAPARVLNAFCFVFLFVFFPRPFWPLTFWFFSRRLFVEFGSFLSDLEREPLAQVEIVWLNKSREGSRFFHLPLERGAKKPRKM